MNKDKYLKEIEKRLEFLTDEQKQTEIFRLNNELDSDNYVNDISNEVEEIYKKYGIDSKKEQIKKERKENLKGLPKYLNNFFEYFKNSSKTMKFTIVRDIIAIIFVALIIKIPFIAIQTALFSIFGTSISDLMYTIIEYILNVIYAVLAILYIITRFKKRFGHEFGID